MFGRALAEHRASQNPAPVQEARKKLARELGTTIFLALAYSACSIPVWFLVLGCSLEFFLAVAMAIFFLVAIAGFVVLGLQHGASSEKAAAHPSSKEAREKLAGEVGLTVFLALMLAACGVCAACIMLAVDGSRLLSGPEVVLLGQLPALLCLSTPVATICTLGGGRIVVVVVLGVECDTVKC